MICQVALIERFDVDLVSEAKLFDGEFVGIFEVMKDLESGKVRCLDWHLERLSQSAKGLECDVPNELPVWIQNVAEAATTANKTVGSIRVIITQGVKFHF